MLQRYNKPIINNEIEELIYNINDNYKIYGLLVCSYINERLIFVQRGREKSLLEMNKKTLLSFRKHPRVKFIFNDEEDTFNNFDDIDNEKIRYIDEIIKSNDTNYKFYLYY